MIRFQVIKLFHQVFVKWISFCWRWTRERWLAVVATASALVVYCFRCGHAYGMREKIGLGESNADGSEAMMLACERWNMFGFSFCLPFFFELRLVRWFFPLFLLHFLRDKFSCCLLSEWWRAEGELLRWKTYVQCKLLFGELVERSNSPLQHRRVEENKKPNVFLMTISQSLYWDQA